MNSYITWIVLAVVVVVGGYFVFNTAPAETGPIKVGAIISLTGDAAAYGEPGRNLIQLAADEINAAGGVDGRMIEMIFEDGKCKGTDAANAAQKLIQVDKVQVIIGGFCSGESLAAEPVATAAKVALFSPGSSSPDLTGKSPYFMRNYPSDATQGVVLATVAKEKGWSKVAVIQEQTDYSLGNYSAFKAHFESLGGAVVKEEFPTGATDFRSQITKLRATNSDALLITVQTAAAASRFLSQVAESGWDPNLLVVDVIAGDATIKAEHAALLEGAIAAEFGASGNDTFKAMEAAYIAKYGGTAVPYASYAQTEYDAVFMVADAIRAVGYDGTKIAKWLRSVKNWEGATGTITMGDNGDPVAGHKAEVIMGGKAVPYTK